MRRGLWTTLVLALPLLPACIDELPSGVLLERPRVLGARAEIEGEPERASPRPGEDAVLRFHTVSNDGAGWTAALTACVAAPALMGFSACAGDPFAFAAPGAPTGSPELAFAVPGPEAFEGSAGSLLFAGVLCANGTPSPEPDPTTMLPTCDGEGATTEVITFELPVALGVEPPNQHPSLSDETITIDDVTWGLPADPPAAGCASAPENGSLPHIALRDEESPSELVFTSDPADRERYQELVFGETPTLVDAREDLTITHVASAGRFERLTTEVFDDDAPDPRVEWEHPPPEDVPADGLTIRFHFVIRDGRGGMDWTERAACLVP